jgi:hypothetical protein
MATPSSAAASAADFSMIPPSPKRAREDEQEEVSSTPESRPRACTSHNMNINIRSAAGSKSQHRGTGEPACSTSQHHLPDCPTELWRVQLKAKTPQQAAAQAAIQSKLSHKSRNRHPLFERRGRSADRRRLLLGGRPQRGWSAPRRETTGRVASTRQESVAASKQRPTMLIFRHARPPDQPPSYHPASDTNG